MGGTIKLVTNQPDPGAFEAAVAGDASQTAGAYAPNRGRAPDVYLLRLQGPDT
jgi:hypothetical protein